MGSSRWLLKLHLHLSISTALMTPRRPKQYCLQLYIYIYIYQTQMKIRHIGKDHLYFDQLVGLPQGESHPEEDRQVGRNIGGLYNVSYLHLCLIYCFMGKNIYTHWMLVRVYIYIYIYIYIYNITQVILAF